MSKKTESIATENRVFKPSKPFSKKAVVKSFDDYKKLYAQSIMNPEKFWAGEASEGRAMYYRFANSILSLFTAGRDEGEIK